VEAPGGRAQALGTEFSIRLNNAAATVTVIEGLVAVTGTGGETARSPQLQAGESLTLLHDGTLTPIETADIAPIRYWREGKIYFNNQRLDTSVAEFNRYLERKLVIGNRELNDLHIGGVFQAGDLDAFLFALEQAFDIEAVESPNAIVLVHR
jgi:transmembrane sensor